MTSAATVTADFIRLTPGWASPKKWTFGHHWSTCKYKQDCVQWRRNRRLNRFNETGAPSTWSHRAPGGPKQGDVKKTSQENNKPMLQKTNNEVCKRCARANTKSITTLHPRPIGEAYCTSLALSTRHTRTIRSQPFGFRPSALCALQLSPPPLTYCSGFQFFYRQKKIQDFSRTFQDPHDQFSGTFSEPKVSNSQLKLGAILYCCLFFIWTTTKMHDFQGYFSRTFQDLKL